MFVIRLPNGNLQVPQTAIRSGDGRLIGDVYVEIGPQDADYARLAEQALTPDEVEQRKDQWRAGDDALRREFQEFARLLGDQFWPGQDAEPQELARRARPRRTSGGSGGRPHAGSLPPGKITALAIYDAAGCPSDEGSLSPRSRARTSDSRNRRCPPGVRMLVIRPDAAHRVTVFGSTRNRAATSPGVSSRSLLPSTFPSPRTRLEYALSLATNGYFLP